MKYISSLTEEQKLKIPEHNKKWIDIGLRTGDTDWSVFEENIKICYEKANLKFPNKIIKVASPIIGALAASIYEAIYYKNRRYAVRDAVDDAVGDAVRGAVDDAVCDAVDGAVRGAVGGAVGDAVDDAVRGAVGGAVDDAVRGAVDGAVRDAVDGAVDGAVRGAVGGAVGDAVGDAVRGAVGDAVRDAVRGAVDDAVCDAVDGAVRGAVGDAVDDAVGDAVKIIKKLSLNNIKWHYWFGGQFWVGYWWGSAYKDFFINVCDLELSNDIIERFEAYKKINESVNYFWTNSDFVMACARPVKINKNKKGQLHCDNDMAIKYPDGWGLWMLNGVRVDEYIVMTPANEIDCNIILKEKNAEVRKEIIKKVGIDRVIKELGAKSIEKSEAKNYDFKNKNYIGKNLGGIDNNSFNINNGYVEYELLNFDCIDGRFRPYLKMLNPSTGDYHVEGVHPDCDTIEKALAWRNGFDLGNYKRPKILT